MNSFDQVFVIEPLALVQIVVRMCAVYVALLLGLRIAGKRELGQMTPYHLVIPAGLPAAELGEGFAATSQSARHSVIWLQRRARHKRCSRIGRESETARTE